MTSLPDPEYHFKFGNLIKTQFFDKKRLFSSLIGTNIKFIHRKANKKEKKIKRSMACVNKALD